jgi:hypothetical protein
MVGAHGLGKYRYNLAHPSARIGLTTSRHLPALRIQPRSDYLHGIGPEQAVAELTELAGRLVDDPVLSVTRLDLYADWQHWQLTPADRDRFITRADHSRIYTQAGQLTGFDFGTRASHGIVARIYDKTLDIARTGADWWPLVWADRYLPGSPVHRVEFEFSRQALKEFDLTTPAETLAATPALWAYATEQWLTHRTPTDDQTRHRWPTSPEWTQVQQAALRQAVAGLGRVRTAKRAGSVRRLLPAITGYLAAFAALAGTEAIDDTLTALHGPLRDYETISRTTFVERITRHRHRNGQP